MFLCRVNKKIIPNYYQLLLLSRALYTVHMNIFNDTSKMISIFLHFHAELKV